MDMTWTEDDDEALAFHALPAWHPTVFLGAILFGASRNDPNMAAQLRMLFVTPESVDAWGDFTELRQIADKPFGIGHVAIWAEGAPDVAYVPLFDPAGKERQPAAFAVLVWRPELPAYTGGAWRLHGIGYPTPPDELHRTAIGFDPRTLG